MEAKDRQVLEKINRHISAVLDYCRDCTSLEEFESNSMRVEACVFNLMQIGELAKTALSDEAKAGITTIPWKQLKGKSVFFGMVNAANENESIKLDLHTDSLGGMYYLFSMN